MHFIFVIVCKQAKKKHEKNMSFQSPMPNQQFLWDVFQRFVFVFCFVMNHSHEVHHIFAINIFILWEFHHLLGYFIPVTQLLRYYSWRVLYTHTHTHSSDWKIDWKTHSLFITNMLWCHYTDTSINTDNRMFFVYVVNLVIVFVHKLPS